MAKALHPELAGKSESRGVMGMQSYFYKAKGLCKKKKKKKKRRRKGRKKREYMMKYGQDFSDSTAFISSSLQLY